MAKKSRWKISVPLPWSAFALVHKCSRWGLQSMPQCCDAFVPEGGGSPRSIHYKSHKIHAFAERSTKVISFLKPRKIGEVWGMRLGLLGVACDFDHLKRFCFWRLRHLPQENTPCTASAHASSSCSCTWLSGTPTPAPLLGENSAAHRLNEKKHGQTLRIHCVVERVIFLQLLSQTTGN